MTARWRCFRRRARRWRAASFTAALADLEKAVQDSNPASVFIEALLLRARLLGEAGRHEESAELWQAIAGREAMLGTLARRAIVENLLAAGRVEPALAALTSLEAGGQAPAELLLRAASAARAAGLLDRAAGLYRRAREIAGRSQLADTAGLGLAETLERAGQLRDALDTFSEVQLTFRSISAYDTATAAARRIAEAIAIEPPAPFHSLHEHDYETIAGRLRGIAAFRRAVDVLEEWRQVFRQTDAAERIESDIIENLYSLRANEEARARAAARRPPNPSTMRRP
jgi:tetratricopeptide (TPR) repeat protein